MGRNKVSAVITHAEILALAGRSIRDEIVKRRQEAATVAGGECAPEHAKLVQDFLDMTERQVSHQLDRLEAVETLYRIETGTRLGLLAELAEEGQDDSDF